MDRIFFTGSSDQISSSKRWHSDYRTEEKEEGEKLVTYQLGEQKTIFLSFLPSYHLLLHLLSFLPSYSDRYEKNSKETEYLKMNWWKIRYLYLRSDFYSKLIILLEIQWCRRTLKEMNIFMYNYLRRVILYIYSCVHPCFWWYFCLL